MSFKYQHQTVAVLWVVVADRARARIFSTDLPDCEQFLEVEALVHPIAKTRMSEVVTDSNGTFAESGGGHHAGEPETDFEHRTAEEFARQIVARLESGRQHNEFGRLALVAPPLMLGVLRQKLSGPLQKLVTDEIGKDLTQLKANDIRAHLTHAEVLVAQA